MLYYVCRLLVDFGKKNFKYIHNQSKSANKIRVTESQLCRKQDKMKRNYLLF